MLRLLHDMNTPDAINAIVDTVTLLLCAAVLWAAFVAFGG